MAFDRLTFADALDARLGSIATINAYVLADPPARPAKGYVVADVTAGTEWAGRMSDTISESQGAFVLRCCGYSREQALRTCDLVLAAMREWRPFDGLTFTAVRLTDTSEVIRDDSVTTDIRFSISLHYRFDA